MSLTELLERRRVQWGILLSGAALTLIFLTQPRRSERVSPPPASPLPVAPPDWEVRVVAQAPRLRFPTAVACAPDGRVFVGEDFIDMTGPDDQPVDRIACVHPDGRLTVFATNLHCVFGLQYVDGRLYVNHAPKFSVFRDAGETGADRVDLLDYTNPRVRYVAARTHVPGNFRLGMDGWFYLAVGDAGLYQAAGRDGSRVHLQGGGRALSPGRHRTRSVRHGHAQSPGPGAERGGRNFHLQQHRRWGRLVDARDPHGRRRLLRLPLRFQTTSAVDAVDDG